MGEYGLVRGQYKLLKELHLFIYDFMDLLAPMDAYFAEAPINDKNDKTSLRYSMRKSGSGGFVFINNYQRLETLAGHENVMFEADGMVFPENGLTIRNGDCFVLPFNISLGGLKLRYATCQLLCVQNGVYFFKQNGVNEPEVPF